MFGRILARAFAALSIKSTVVRQTMRHRKRERKREFLQKRAFIRPFHRRLRLTAKKPEKI